MQHTSGAVYYKLSSPLFHYTRLAYLVSVVALTTVVYGPFIWYSHPEMATVGAPELELARATPHNDVFQRVLMHSVAFGEQPLEARSEAILLGRYSLAGRPQVELGLPPKWTADPFNDPAWSLEMQALQPAQALLAQFQATGDTKYLDGARVLVLSWIRWSQTTTLGANLMWNDHAVAERVLVLARFWQEFRQAQQFHPVDGQLVLASIKLHIDRLAEPSRFTFRTNHGMIQNIVLLQLSTLFPDLVNGYQIRQLAISRLNEQFKLLISPNGVMLEHSPDYHRFAVRVVENAISILNQTSYPVPKTWPSLLAKLKKVELAISRPDNSLPPIGDTRITCHTRSSSTETSSPQNTLVLPYEGWAAISRHTGSASDFAQLTATWQHFPNHGHKHADELSVYLFERGVQWLGGVGYWSYADRSGRLYATGWSGSNAPTFRGESAAKERTSALRGMASGNGVDFLHMSRIGPDKFKAERQVIWIRGKHLIILDNVDSPDGMPMIRWRTEPHVEIGVEQGRMSWLMRTSTGQQTARVSVSGPGLTTTVHTGSESPFDGWAFTSQGPRPVPTLIVESNRNVTQFLTLLSTEAEILHGQTVDTPTPSTENWQINVNIDRTNYSLVRRDESLHVESNSSEKRTISTLPIQSPPTQLPIRRSHDIAWVELREKYKSNPVVAYIDNYSGTARRLLPKFLAFIVGFELLLAWMRRRKHMTQTIWLQIIGVSVCLAAVSIVTFKITRM